MLYEKGIEHEKHEMRHASDREALLAVNPRGQVPAITHGDALIYDSTVICEYLESVSSDHPLVPAAPAERARCSVLDKMADGPFDAVVIVLAIVKMIKPELQEQYPAVVDDCLAKIHQMYAFLDRELAGRDFLCGELSRVDLAFAAQFPGTAFLGAETELPAVLAWQQRLAALPSVQRATAEFMEAFQHSREDADPFFGRDEMHVRDHRIEWILRLGLGSWLIDEQRAGGLAFSPVP